LKILVWDGTGMVLIYKVLEQGNFAWVKTGPEGINPSSGRIEGMNARRAGGAGRHDAAVAGTVRGAV
jgi:transposase